MRNLILNNRQNFKIPYNNAQNMIFDSSNDADRADNIYVFTKESLVFINCVTGDENPLCEIDSSKILIGAECLAFDQAICWAYDDGEVWMYEFGLESDSIGTSCKDGLEAMGWSPDQEIVVFVTKTRSMVVMDRNLNVLHEVTNVLDDSAFGDQEFITVGWGKKETQFHGSEGKQAAKQKNEIQLPENLSNIDKSISITWREDGELYAIGYYGASGRMFKVFNKEGELQFTSEICNGLENCIAWRPTGNWIAIPQTFPNKYVIALFEKNGLRHREFALPFKRSDEKVIDLGWSFDSECLSVVTENLETGFSSIYVYTVSNYHWYLKQNLDFNNRIKKHVWCTNTSINRFKPKCLGILFDNSSVAVYKWDFNVVYNKCKDNKTESIVAVIDANNLLLTNFRNVVIPPPMCEYTFKHVNAINSCGFLLFPEQMDENNMGFIVDSKGYLHILRFELTESCRIKNVANFATFDLKMIKNFFKGLNPESDLYSFIFYRSNIVLCASNKYVYLLRIDYDKKEIIEETQYCRSDEISNIGGLSASKLYISSPDEIAVHEITSSFSIEPVSPFSWSVGVENYDQIDCVLINNEYEVITFKYRGSIYYGQTKIAFNVTSYYILENFLIFTTIEKLNFFDMKRKKIISDRKIETGGRIIMIIPNNSRVVLQMPRGNLETVEPRILSIKIIGSLLDNLEYNKAFDTLRKQRINLNIIVDHNFKKFIENIPKFLNEIPNPNWLNLFLSELQNDNVTKTMYANNYEDESIAEQNIPLNKIEVICRLMCDCMESCYSINFLLPIITTYVKCNNIEKALQRIWDLKKLEVSSNRVNSGEKSQSDDALKYIICLVDVNELYNIALGMYDFDLVMFVANKSQKDPKEYVKFLNDLKSIENENYRNYTICVYLKRYEAALQNILQCDSEQYLTEIMDLVQKYGLYIQALDLLNRNDDKYKKIATMYGDYLRVKGGNRNLWEASVMYERGGDYKQALTSAKHILDLYRCEYLMKKLNYSTSEIEEFCNSMMPALHDGKCNDKIAHILIVHKKDYTGGLVHLLSGHLFKEAGNLIKRQNLNPQDQFVSEAIDYEANEYKTFLNENISPFILYTNRLDFVRKHKIDNPATDFVDPNFDDNDDVSSINSMTSKRTDKSSTASGKSSQSSRNRRKMERKVLSLKEGNPYEELGLIDALHTTINAIMEQRSKVEEICHFLVEVEQDNHAASIQNIYQNVLNLIKQSLDVIFTNEMQIPENIDLNNYQIIQKSKYYQLLKTHLRFKPHVDFQFEELSILK